MSRIVSIVVLLSAFISPIAGAQQTTTHSCTGPNIPSSALTQTVSGDLTLAVTNCNSGFADVLDGSNFLWTTSTTPTAVTVTVPGNPNPIVAGVGEGLTDANVLFQLSGSTPETIQVTVYTSDTSYTNNRATYTFTLNPGGGSSGGLSGSSGTPATAVPTLPLFGLLTLGGLVGLFGLRKLKK